MNVNDLKSWFIKHYGESKEEVQCFFSPGRVNLIGEHIDYNGGYVFPGALTLGIYGLCRMRADNMVRLTSLNAEESLQIRLNEALCYDPADGWGNYPKGVLKHLLDEGKELRGRDVLYYGNLPDGAGLSSSAALEVLTAYMFMADIEGEEVDRAAMAILCQRAENQFVGVNCGIMDQFAVALGKRDNAILLDCDRLQYEYAPLKLDGASLVIMNTNKKRELSESKYNERRAECDAALKALRERTDVKSLCQADLKDAYEYLKDEKLLKRTRHAITENNRVLKAVEVLGKGQLHDFGKLMVESHISLRDNYEVTGAELDTIFEAALNVEGCIGCRMTGAGFGGCAVAIVETGTMEDFKRDVARYYTEKTGLKPDFYVTEIGDGVRRILL
ncbi:MAG: galactokinase [Bacillota bacterium]